ncbi:hypothetical protein [Microbulbifer thermotolerans]|uniref:hypothetical protein n=1 Tax=Microbulbifer thermotolerans TaxID=252514 RepID=UPI002248BB08|nr:hypothetical protein [Microbulbifer thermotolerans]MCX2781051.1 hypothetical protein [Microbulbifer thermotolerans]MCX2796221.1 hypothetical protein [Microbulbifer thermotolerans]MCX2806368.1 hypothetical protein [Microbulbifer thermotolerans]
MIKNLFILIGIMLLSACSSAPYENFDPTSVQGKTSLKVVSQVQQDEIIKEFVPSNASSSAGAQFGLVGALVGVAVDTSINNSRAKDAEAAVEPFRNATLDINVRNLLEQAFTDKIEQLDWVTEKKLVSELLEPSTKIKNYLASMDEDLLLLINTTYSLKPNAEVIEFTAGYSLFDKTTTTNTKSTPKPVYSNIAKVQSYPHNGSVRRLTKEEKEAEIAKLKEKYPTDESLPKLKIYSNQKTLAREIAKINKKTITISNHEPAGSIWLNNNGELLRKEMLAAPELLAKMIINDLSGEYPLPMDVETNKKKKRDSQPLEEFDNGMVISREPNGMLLYKHRDAPVYTRFGASF